MLQGSKKDLEPSRPFHRVLPRTARPLGWFALLVTFGARDNFRTEKIVFDVADIDLPYNAIIGRPDFKIPGPKGVIVERMDTTREVVCLEDIFASERAAEKLETPVVADSGAPSTRVSAPAKADTKKIALDVAGSKTVTISDDLDPK